MTSNSIRYDQAIPDILQGLETVEQTISRHGFDVSLRHLVKLRASQINQCAFCVTMHTKEARADGESNERLDRLIVWRYVNDFSLREKAALRWTEALTRLHNETDYQTLKSQLQQHFSDHEISTLTAIIIMINLWNRLQVSQH